jgi:cobalt-zinc-cadmium efflux system outer membrane protein
VSLSLHGQGSKSLTLAECESVFLKKNLSILAAEYNITAARAGEIQAALWPNPYVSAELNAINPVQNKVLDVGSHGEKVFYIQQLILLGGKKKNEIALAKTNTAAAELDFQDLLRNLKYQLRINYFSAYYDSKSLELVNGQFLQLDSLIKSYKVQLDKGNVAMKDMVRLQALLLELNQSRTELANDVRNEFWQLSTLLADSQKIYPTPLNKEINIAENLILPEDSLIAFSRRNRPDYLLFKKTIEAAEFNLKWQKSLAIPDLSVGAGYDQRGGAFNNQLNLTLGMPLVLWNRNQGNVATAQADVQRTELNFSKKDNELVTEIKSSLELLKINKQNKILADSMINPDYLAVWKSVYRNFARKNISIIEFTDFVESYLQSSIYLNQMEKSFLLSRQQINWVTNTEIFK